MTLVDIAIVNYNSTRHLVACLNSIFDDSSNPNLSVHVQDNHSSDGVDRIPELFPMVVFEKNPRNMGFAKAVNQMLRRTRSDYVILVNPDATLQRGFVSRAVDFMDRHPDVGIMGPRILDADGRLQNSARAFPTLLTAFFGRSSFLSRKFPGNPITSKNLLSLGSDGKSPMDVDWVSGACMVVRRRAMEDAGMLDERFFMYWEDTDWCRRMVRKCWRVVYYPRISARHYVGGSSEKSVLRSGFAFHKSAYLLFDKYLEARFAFLRPLVMGGLAVRLCLVMLDYAVAEWIRKKRRNRADAPGDARPPRVDKIKIIRIISRLNIGGPSIHVYLLTRGLDTERFDTLLVTGRISPQEGDMAYLFGPNDPRPFVIPELQREIWPPMDVKAFVRIFKLLMAEKPHIVDTHTAKAGFMGRLAAWCCNVWCCNVFGKRKIRIIHTFHGHVFVGYFSRLNSWVFITIERFLALITDRIVTISDTQREEIVNRFRIAPESKVKTIPLGFDLAPFLTAKQHRGGFRKEFGISDDAFLIGIIGRLVPIKNHRLLLAAAKRFSAYRPDLNVVFAVVGDGELREPMEAECREMGLTDKVIFCGWVRDVKKVYADLDVLALTSINEGTPVSIIESMAASVPVIATDAGGVRDLFGADCESDPAGPFKVCDRGVLCKSNDPEGFAQGLSFLAGESERRRMQRAARAKAFVTAQFGADRLFRDMAALYDGMIRADR